MRTLMNDFREMFMRYRVTLLCGYAAAAWAFVLVYLFAPRTSFLAFISVAWIIAPAILIGPGEDTPLRTVAAIFVTGGVYAACWVLGTHILRGRRERRAHRDETSLR